jgi:hypothetical protein
MKGKWMDITHPCLWDGWLPEFIYQFWKKVFCPKGWHLFDECQSQYSHSLFCDACGLDVKINDYDEEELEHDCTCDCDQCMYARQDGVKSDE